MISASRDQRISISNRLRNMLSDIGSEAEWICDEAVGCKDEYLTTDLHQLEIVLLAQATEFMALMTAYKAERDRLAASHSEMLSEIDMHERSDSRVGYGHLQAEMV